MPHKDPITETLKEARIKRGLSVLELAEVLDIPADRIYKWDQGKSAPKFKDREKVDKWLTGKNFHQDEPKTAQEAPNSPGYVPASDLIQVLKEQNEFLRRNFETSLINLMEGQQAASAHLKTLLRYNVEVANKEDPKRAEQDLIKVHNMLAFYAGVGGEEGNFHTDSSKSTSGQRKGS